MLVCSSYLLTFTWFRGSLCLLTMCALTLPVAAQLPTSTLLAADLLQGGVEHSERLSALGDHYQVGKSVEVKTLPALKGTDDWFSIPTWLAGTWKCIQSVRTLSYLDEDGTSDNHSTILKCKERETFGWQQDAVGNIWTCKQEAKPSEVEETEVVTENNKELERTVVVIRFKDNQLISAEKEKMFLKTMDTSIKVDRSNHKLVSVERLENLRTLTWLGDELMSVQNDIQTFDSQGFPIERRKETSIYRRSSRFSKVDDLAGRSLLMSFCRFLERTGQASLTPRKRTEVHEN